MANALGYHVQWSMSPQEPGSKLSLGTGTPSTKELFLCQSMSMSIVDLYSA